MEKGKKSPVHSHQTRLKPSHSSVCFLSFTADEKHVFTSVIKALNFEQKKRVV